MNKELEHIFERLKFVTPSREHSTSINGEEINLLLSYIEQLEKRIYKARKMIFDNYGVLDKYEIEMLDDILKGDSDE